MFFKRDLTLTQEYLGFLLLNVFDLFLSGYIFRNGGREGNGAALWIQHRFGDVGFAVYKFLLVVVVVLACEGISLKNLRLARQIVTAGCVVLTLVVCWEVFLIFTRVYSGRAL